MNSTLSLIFRIFLVLAVVGVAGYYLYPFLMEYLAPAEDSDPFGPQFEALNVQISNAKTVPQIALLRENTTFLRSQVALTKYAGYLELSDAQLSALGVLNASALYDAETALIAKNGIDCTKDYSALEKAFREANATKKSALASLASYLSKNPDSSASAIANALTNTDTEVMHLFASILEEERGYLCLEDQTPDGAYALPLNMSEAARLVVNEAWSSGYNVYSIGGSLPAGTNISVERPDGTLNSRIMDSDTWFFMMDRYPDALWAHEVIFVFVDVETAKFQVSAETSHPIINGISYWLSLESRLDARWIIYPENPLLNASASTSPRRTFVDGKLYTWPLAIASVPDGTECGKIDCCKGAGKNKALVVSGNDQNLFHNDAQGMYNFLRAGKHMSADDITYLTAKSGIEESDGKTNLASFKEAIENLAKEVKCCDRIFIYLTGHGNNITMYLFKNKVTGEETWYAPSRLLGLNRSQWEFQKLKANFHHIAINPYKIEAMPDGTTVERGDRGGGVMWAEDISAMLNKLKSCYVTLMYDSCHSGPAARWLAGKGRSVMTTSNAGSAWGLNGHGVFNTQWIYAHGLFADEADADNDGVVSDKEAFDYANRETQHIIKNKIGKDQSGTWTGPKPPCVCCNVVCNQTTKYLCTVVDGNGTISPFCKKTGDYCGPDDTYLPPPNTTENWTPGTGGSSPVGGTGEATGTVEAPVCGDGIKSSMEECETDSDCPKYRYCSNCICKQYPLVCGDGKIAAGEECDPKASPTGCMEGLNCDFRCRCVEPESICGDGIVKPPEECDTGVPCASENQQCNMATCRCEDKPAAPPPSEGYCGDGILQSGESCEFSSQCPSDYTCSNCKCVKLTVEYCGDGKINLNEQCDPKASPTGCDFLQVCSQACTCVSPPILNCENICAQTPPAQSFGGGYGSAQACADAVSGHYLPGLTCYLTCTYSWYYSVTNIAGTSSCCCGMKKQFLCSDCPGQNPVCPGQETCQQNAPSWYVPPQ